MDYFIEESIVPKRIITLRPVSLPISATAGSRPQSSTAATGTTTTDTKRGGYPKEASKATLHGKVLPDSNPRSLQAAIASHPAAIISQADSNLRSLQAAIAHHATKVRPVDDVESLSQDEKRQRYHTVELLESLVRVTALGEIQEVLRAVVAEVCCVHTRMEKPNTQRAPVPRA